VSCASVADVSGFSDWLAKLFGAPAEPPRAAPAPPPAATAGIGADDPRIPDATRPRVARLLALIADLEARTGHDPLLAAQATEVRQMRASHLPALVASYADIPPAHRAEIFRRTGRSASYTLNEGVDRMIERAETLSRALAEENIDSFADNLRFIETRYGNKDPLG